MDVATALIDNARRTGRLLSWLLPAAWAARLPPPLDTPHPPAPSTHTCCHETTRPMGARTAPPCTAIRCRDSSGACDSGSALHLAHLDAPRAAPTSACRCPVPSITLNAAIPTAHFGTSCRASVYHELIALKPSGHAASNEPDGAELDSCSAAASARRAYEVSLCPGPSRLQFSAPHLHDHDSY